MATQTSLAPCDCSTFANFKSWASLISGVLGSSSVGGFVQAADPGQVVWTTLTATLSLITGNAGSGTVNATTTAAHGFRVGTVVIISGTTNFNGTFIITAVTATTFAFAQVNASANETAGTATVNAQSVVGDILVADSVTNNTQANTAFPTLWRGLYSAGTTYAIGDSVWNANNVFVSIANANTGNTPVGGASDTKWKSYCCELWQSNDGLTPFVLKIEYGMMSANVPQVATQFGNTTTGTGSLSGNTSTRELVGSTSFGGGNPTGATASTTTFECDFYGAQNGSTFGMIMWRTATTTICSLFVGFERSKAASGTDTAAFVSYVIGGGGNNVTTPSTWRQCSLFLSGASPTIGVRSFQAVTLLNSATDVPAPGGVANSWQVGNNIPAGPVFPCIGFFATPFLLLQGIRTVDAVEGGQFTVTMYANTHTYLMTKQGWAQSFGNQNGTTGSTVFAMRWE